MDSDRVKNHKPLPISVPSSWQTPDHLSYTKVSPVYSFPTTLQLQSIIIQLIASLFCFLLENFSLQMVQTTIHEMNEENDSTTEAINDCIKLLNSCKIQQVQNMPSSPRFIMSSSKEDPIDEVDLWTLDVRQKPGRPLMHNTIAKDKPLKTNKRRPGRPPKERTRSDDQLSKIQDFTLNNGSKSLVMFKRRLRERPRKINIDSTTKSLCNLFKELALIEN